MNRLSGSDQAQLTKLAEDVTGAKDACEAAIAAFNEEVTALFEAKVAPLVDQTNVALEALQAEVDRLHSQMQDYADARSEAWQNGKRGEAYLAWMERFESISGELDPIELEDLGMLEMAQVEVPEEFPASPGEA